VVVNVQQCRYYIGMLYLRNDILLTDIIGMTG